MMADEYSPVFMWCWC